MTYHEMDVLLQLAKTPYENQRSLASATDSSLGLVNKALQNLVKDGYLKDDFSLTEAAGALIARGRPKRAIILAAGFGMRMIPIHVETSKGLLEVHGERLIERQIRQLKACGIHDITIVVGFMKEHYEYLMDEFDVTLVVNPHYARRNNLYSLYLVRDHLCDSYIVPCDLYCYDSPFRESELHSWYMVTSQLSPESTVRINRRRELVPCLEGEPGNAMIGIAYLTEEDGQHLKDRLNALHADPRSATMFWEEALEEDRSYFLPARVVSPHSVVEINTYEQLRDVDSHSSQLKSEALSAIAEAMGGSVSEIREITILKKGMTNRSFIFTFRGRRYIMRIPGEGAEILINRKQEAEVYRVISGLGFCDDPIYIDPVHGYKITGYLENVRSCDALNEEDLKRSTAMLRRLHEMNLKVDHTFDIFQEALRYETLLNGTPSVYRDYASTKERIFALKPFIEKTRERWCLTHIDANPDNLLFYPSGLGEGLQLTDWEYAGMQDPDVDLAMFCIYALYDRSQIDHFIDLYCEGSCSVPRRMKIYAYVAACGFLWSNWCEYKRTMGVEFGEYALRQYRYAKDYLKILDRYFAEDAHA